MNQIYKKLSRQVFGDKHAVPLDLRASSVSALYSGIVLIVLALTSLGLGLPASPLVLLALGGVCIGMYAVARIGDDCLPQNRALLAIPLLLLIGAALAYLWIQNAGTSGGAHYFFFLAACATCVLLRGIWKFVSVLALLGLVTVLIWLEHSTPGLVRPHIDETQRFLDILISFVLALLFFVWIISTITRNYAESHRLLENFRLHYSEDLEIARQLQKRIYHHREFDAVKEQYDLALAHMPAGELSGDLYELSQLKSGRSRRLRVLLADARGHGINASLTAMLIKSEWANLDHAKLSPAKALRALNDRFSDHYEDAVSFSAVIVDLHRSKLVFASAGHDLQYLLSAGTGDSDGTAESTQLASSGPPIGILEGARYSESEHRLTAGDRLLLFTDALCEELDEHDQPLGARWFLDGAQLQTRPSGQFLDRLLREFAARRGRQLDALGNTDDLTVLVVGHRD